MGDSADPTEDTVVEDSEEFANDSAPTSDPTDDTVVDDTIVEDSEEFANDNAPTSEQSENTPTVKLSKFPVSSIRRLMKYGLNEDDGVKMVNKESAFVVGQATELFIAALAQQAAKITRSTKKKTMTMQHLISSINDSEVFSFLEGTMVPDYNF